VYLDVEILGVKMQLCGGKGGTAAREGFIQAITSLSSAYMEPITKIEVRQ
jgi:hypothetical protein